MTSAERVAKLRAMRKAGFVHVNGWVRKEDAQSIIEKINAASAELEGELKNG